MKYISSIFALVLPVLFFIPAATAFAAISPSVSIINHPLPIITTCTLSASPLIIHKGGEAAPLFPELTYTTSNATSFTVNHGVGTLTPVSYGFTLVSPAGTITYTGTATGPDGTATCSATVTVVTTPSAPKPVITSTSAAVAGDFEINAGGDATILGRNFLSATGLMHVFIGSTQATVNHVWSKQLNINVPSTLTPGKSYGLYVSNGNGISNTVQVKMLSGKLSSHTAGLVPSTTFVNFSAKLGDGRLQTYEMNLTNTSSAPVSIHLGVPNQPKWWNTGYNTNTITIAAGGVLGIGVAADTTKVTSPGTYTSRLIISGNFTNSPITIPVKFTVVGTQSSAPTITSISLTPVTAKVSPVQETMIIHGTRLTSGGNPKVEIRSTSGVLKGTMYYTNMNYISSQEIIFKPYEVTSALVPGTKYEVVVVTPNGTSNAMNFVWSVSTGLRSKTFPSGENTLTKPNTTIITNYGVQTSSNVLQGPFTQNLWNGQNNREIAQLQRLLNQNAGTRIAVSGPGSQGEETDHYGYLTQSAVQNFQCENHIVCSGSPDLTGYGVVGPRTREKLNELYNQEGNHVVAATTGSTNIINTNTSKEKEIATLKAQIQKVLQMVLQLQKQLEKQVASQ